MDFLFIWAINFPILLNPLPPNMSLLILPSYSRQLRDLWELMSWQVQGETHSGFVLILVGTDQIFDLQRLPVRKGQLSESEGLSRGSFLNQAGNSILSVAGQPQVHRTPTQTDPKEPNSMTFSCRFTFHPTGIELVPPQLWFISPVS